MAYDDLDDPPMDDATYEFLLSEHDVWGPASDPTFEDTIPKESVHVALIAFRGPEDGDWEAYILGEQAESQIGRDGYLKVLMKDIPRGNGETASISVEEVMLHPPIWSDPELEDTVPKSVAAVVAVNGSMEQVLVSRYLLPDEKEARIEIPSRRIPSWAVFLEFRVTR